MPDFILDTSAYVNGWNYHYRPPMFQGVWDAIAPALDSGVIQSPSEVLVELKRKAGDDLHTWAMGHPSAFVDPTEDWSPHFAAIRLHAEHWFTGAGKHDADPFVVAMAMQAGARVVTYEGQTFSGEPARVRVVRRSMPIVCTAVGVQSVTMVDVLGHLGVSL